MTTLEALDRLETAGFSREQSAAIVAAFNDQAEDRLATKADLSALEARLYRALWMQGGTLAALILAAKFL